MRPLTLVTLPGEFDTTCLYPRLGLVTGGAPRLCETPSFPFKQCGESPAAAVYAWENGVSTDEHTAETSISLRVNLTDIFLVQAVQPRVYT